VRRVCAIAAAIIGFGAAAADATAQAPSGVPRIGYLQTNATVGWFEAFQRGLSELGYVENRTIIIERRSAAGQIERLPDLAAELVRLQPRVIVASTPPAALAAKNATATIPIVIANAGDPVGLGLAASLARPGGNVTGLSNLAAGLGAKRLELLAEIVPGLSRVGVIWEPDGGEGPQLAYRELQAARAALHLEIESFEVARPGDFDDAFKAAAARVGGVAVLNSTLVTSYREIVIAAAARHKVPTIYYNTEEVEVGGLISYGASGTDMHRRAAIFVDKILKGAKPADLPVEQASKFELVINLKTAKALGITIPRSFLLRADEVIE
jgi:putative ABC transport system substrate-binding protein